MTIEDILQMINENFLPVFKAKGYSLTYKFARTYPKHIRIGFESTTSNVKLLFVYEMMISLFIGTIEKPFTDEGEWIYFNWFVDFLLKRPICSVPEQSNKPYIDFLKEDLANTGREFEKYNEQIFPLFHDKTASIKCETDYRNYVREENNRKYSQPKKI
jgi:hypothetical protein